MHAVLIVGISTIVHAVLIVATIVHAVLIVATIVHAVLIVGIYYSACCFDCWYLL